MIELAEAVAEINPWYIFSAGVLLIALDALLFGSEALLWIGLVLLVGAGENALGFPPLVQLWSYPLLAIAVVLLQRRIGGILNSSADPYAGLEAYIGQTGRLRISETEIDNAQYFDAEPARSILESVREREYLSEPTQTRIVKIEMKDGKTLPASLPDRTDASDGDVVEVVEVQSQTLQVIKKR